MTKIDRFHYFAPNQNLIKIDYKFTTNTKATFYDIMSDFVRNCPTIYFLCNKFTQKRTAGVLTMITGGPFSI